MLFNLQGGIKAVVWTDTFQALVLMGSFLAVIIVGSNEAGHWDTVIDLNYQTDRIEFFVWACKLKEEPSAMHKREVLQCLYLHRFDLDMTERYTVWSLVVGGAFFWLTLMVNQATVQRYISLRSKKEAKT